MYELKLNLTGNHKHIDLVGIKEKSTRLMKNIDGFVLETIQFHVY